jgi:hypothetical protein
MPNVSTDILCVHLSCLKGSLAPAFTYQFLPLHCFRSHTPGGAKPSQEKSVHFSQNPLYKNSDDAEAADENLAVNIYGTQEDLGSSLYDNTTAHRLPETTSAIPRPAHQGGPGANSRYSVESSDLPSYYVPMKTKPSPSNATLRSDDAIFVTDSAADQYVSADQLADGVEARSNPLYDLYYSDGN